MRAGEPNYIGSMEEQTICVDNAAPVGIGFMYHFQAKKKVLLRIRHDLGLADGRFSVTNLGNLDRIRHDQG